MKLLIFSYSLPVEPSRARVYVWRQLKKLGAVNYQSAWVFPSSPERISEMKKLMEEIRKYKGGCLLIEGKSLDKQQAEEIQKALLESRNEKYAELIEKCEDFFIEIAQEIERENFTFTEVAENEKALEKLKKWMKKVEKRAVVDTPLRKIAIEKIRTCEKLLDDFTKTVFLHLQESDGTSIKGSPRGRKRKIMKRIIPEKQSMKTPSEEKTEETNETQK